MEVYVSNVTKKIYTNIGDIIQEAVDNGDLMLLSEWMAEEIYTPDLIEKLVNNSAMTCKEFLDTYREDYDDYLANEMEYFLEKSSSDYWMTEIET